MTKVLGRIGTFIQENPDQVIVLSISEVADASQASIASVMRLCKELDFTSFASFKLALASELAVQANGRSGGAASATNESFSKKLGDSICMAIRTNTDAIKPTEIDEVAHEIIRARQVILHGVGASFIPASFMSYKLTRLGIVNHLSTDLHMTSMVAHASGPEDLLLLFSSSGSVRESIELAELATQTSLPSIAFTNRYKSPLGEACGKQLTTVGAESPLSSGSLESKCGQLLIVEWLFNRICEISQVHAQRIREAADAVANKHY